MANKSKKIIVDIVTEPVKIFVLTRKKHKLTELYPQRAILEENRKNSSLIQANDWIDHDYYEKEVEEAKIRDKRIMSKYGIKIPKSSLPPLRPIKTYKITPMEQP